MLANLVQLLGPDEVTSRVYGVNPKIKFKIQNDMIDIRNSEWEILNDCRSLWKLYNLCDKDIDLLVEKIHTKINERDLNYFHSQRNVISLYDALVNNFEIENESQLLDIAKALYIPNDYDIFCFDEWTDFDYLGTPLCASKTCDFIINLNDFNRTRYKEKVGSII